MGPPEKRSLWDFNRSAHEERQFAERYRRALAHEVGGWVIQAFATLTFPEPRSVSAGMSAAKGWVEALRHLGPGPDLFALLVPERGETGGLVHVHAVLGGLVPREVPPPARPFELAWMLRQARERWTKRTRGRVRVERPNNRRAVATYVTKVAWAAEWELIGSPIKRRRRRRRAGLVRATENTVEERRA